MKLCGLFILYSLNTCKYNFVLRIDIIYINFGAVFKTMNQFKNISASIFLLFVSFVSLYAQDKGYAHEISAGVRPSYILQTNGYYAGFNPLGGRIEQSASAHLEYTFRLPADSPLGSLYNSYQGIGAGIHTFGSHDYIGTPLSIYAVQGASLATFGRWATLDYRWNLGLSYGWVNENTKLTSTKLNAYLGVGLLFSLYAGRHFKFSIGPEFAHYSNGDTKFPNTGTNTLGLKAGISGRFGNDEAASRPDRIFMKDPENKRFSERMTYDLIAYGSWRADRFRNGQQVYNINEIFPVYGLMFNPLFHFNRYLSLGPSVDFIYDRSANLINHMEGREFVGYEFPSWKEQVAPGVSLKGELRMAFIAINAGYGYSFSPEGSELDVLYAVFGLKTFLSDSFYLNLGYRLNN